MWRNEKFPQEDLRPLTHTKVENQDDNDTALTMMPPFLLPVVSEHIAHCWHINEMESARMTELDNSLKGERGCKAGQGDPGSTNPIPKQITSRVST